MSYMSKVYAELIVKGKMKIEVVPENLKQEVQQILGQESNG